MPLGINYILSTSLSGYILKIKKIKTIEVKVTEKSIINSEAFTDA